MKKLSNTLNITTSNFKKGTAYRLLEMSLNAYRERNFGFFIINYHTQVKTIKQVNGEYLFDKEIEEYKEKIIKLFKTYTKSYPAIEVKRDRKGYVIVLYFFKSTDKYYMKRSKEY